MSVLIESKSRGLWFCKWAKTWETKSAILKIGGPKSQLLKTYEIKSAF